MSTPTPAPADPGNSVYDITLCVEDLQAALSAHGITLPSLRVALPGVALGNCNAATARRLAAVLRGLGTAPSRPPLDVELPAVPEALQGLRRTVRRYLDAPCSDVQLCVTELVTNVIRHVEEGIQVRVRVARTDGDRIRVEVTDPARQALPVALPSTPDDEAGRGLALLDAVALRWGVEREVEGKTVWCELDGADAVIRTGGAPAGASHRRQRKSVDVRT